MPCATGCSWLNVYGHLPRFARVRPGVTSGPGGFLPPASPAATWANVGACPANVGHQVARKPAVAQLTAPAGSHTHAIRHLGRPLFGHGRRSVHLARHRKVGKEGDGAAKRGSVFGSSMLAPGRRSGRSNADPER